MKATIDKGIIDIISLAEKYPTIKRIGIFGSYAKGNMRSDSDIDLLYDYDDTDSKSTDDLLGYIEEINDILISYTNVNKIDYVWYKGLIDSNNSVFRNTVLDEVVWTYEQ